MRFGIDAFENKQRPDGIQGGIIASSTAMERFFTITRISKSDTSA